MLTREWLTFFVGAAVQFSGYPQVAVEALPSVRILKDSEIAARSRQERRSKLRQNNNGYAERRRALERSSVQNMKR